jgi:hypothetical protein
MGNVRRNDRQDVACCFTHYCSSARNPEYVPLCVTVISFLSVRAHKQREQEWAMSKVKPYSFLLYAIFQSATHTTPAPTLRRGGCDLFIVSTHYRLKTIDSVYVSHPCGMMSTVFVTVPPGHVRTKVVRAPIVTLFTEPVSASLPGTCVPPAGSPPLLLL